MSRILKVAFILVACTATVCAYDSALAQVGQGDTWNPGPPPAIEASPASDEPLGGSPLGCVGNPTVEVPAGALAIVTVPASIGNGDVVLEIWNAIDTRIAYVTLDGSEAQGAQGLHFDAVSVLRHPSNGLAEVRYPAAGVDGIGPAVLAFENGGLLRNDCSSMELRVGSWDQHVFPAKVIDMLDTQVRMVFGDGLRGYGKLQLCPQTARLQIASVGKIVCRPGDAVAVIAEQGSSTK